MEFDLMEWINLALRWTHIFAGIMWVGATFFFTWLDGRFTKLSESKALSDDDKNVWMVHSGGFYVVAKQKSPRVMPERLHWFRWEAAATWFSGLLLLLYLYYHGGLMVEEAMNETAAMLTGLGLIILSWPVYNFLWKSPLARNERVINIFDTAAGPVAVILVGAINVGSMETTWHGCVTPPYGKEITTWHYDKQTVSLRRGEEMGRFNMGSTVILLFAKDAIDWCDGLKAGDLVTMGQCFGMSE